MEMLMKPMLQDILVEQRDDRVIVKVEFRQFHYINE